MTMLKKYHLSWIDIEIIHKNWSDEQLVMFSIDRGQGDNFVSIMVLGHSLNWIPEITTLIKYHKISRYIFGLQKRYCSHQITLPKALK